MAGFRTVLVVFRDPGGAESLCRLASGLARHWRSHVVGLYILPRIVIKPAHLRMPRVDEFKRQVERLRADSQRIHMTFTATAASAEGDWHWRHVEAESETAADIAVRHARCADIVVVGRQGKEADFIHPDMILEDLLMASGRPVLVAPSTFDGSAQAERIAVAWNGSREAARAVFDAMPLLELAGTGGVRILRQEAETGASPAELDLVETLARHGIGAETVALQTGFSDAGERLLAECSQFRATMLVMGAYGHSRLREYILGGATDTVITDAPIPVLLSH